MAGSLEEEFAVVEAAHASATKLFIGSNDTLAGYDDQPCVIIIIPQHVPAAVLFKMEIPSQQLANDVLTAARAASLLRRHTCLRGQDVTSAQGKQKYHWLFCYLQTIRVKIIVRSRSWVDLT